MLKGLGNLGDMAKMMAKAQEFQGKMAEAQAAVEALEVEGEAGAGLVKATVTGKGELKRLSIDPTLFVPEDREAVEDLIVAAIKTAQDRAAEAAQAEMAKAAEGLPLPPGMKLPF
ncbi:YbaB/EbfC family nucleoid-associated protein [uncultured Albimonas sp.]|uniref:YbaB/EbfC family nucleoid-associated protein n=1 Tax=uncultured Albimonas sp. TaxID=1331701 RepID=UPI0030EE73B8